MTKPASDAASGCWGKLAFASASAAAKQRDLVRRKRGERSGARLIIYRCPHCHAWHFGHQIKGVS